MFDSSVQRGTTAKFPLNGVIAGWTEGLQLMAIGDKARFWIPEELAYKGRKGVPAGMLVFDIELIKIIKLLSQKIRILIIYHCKLRSLLTVSLTWLLK